jgi:hypothetical protein
LRAEYIGLGKRVWRLFPGKDYRFLDFFEGQQVAFLDFPGMILPDGNVTRDTPMLRERVILARAVQNWAIAYQRHVRNAMTGSPPPEPSRDLGSYTKGHRVVTNDVGAIVSFFGEAKQGDLVVIPDKLSSRRVLIGEFLEPPERRLPMHIARYGAEQVPARRVRWFPSVEELSLPEGLSDVLRRPNPFTLLGKQFHQDIYSGSYGTFYGGDVFATRFHTRAPDFTNSDNFDFGIITTLWSKICADIAAGKTDVTYADLSILFEGAIPPEFKPSMACNINSPGLFDFKASTIVPLFAAVMFALASVATVNVKQVAARIS